MARKWNGGRYREVIGIAFRVGLRHALSRKLSADATAVGVTTNMVEPW
jgi:hypothetical protein